MKAASTAIRPQQALAPAPKAEIKPVSFCDVSGNNVELSVQLVKQFLCPNSAVTDAEAYMFVELCKFRKLNPWTREAYAIKYGSNPLQMVVGKDAFTKRAQKNPKYRGSKAGVVVVNLKGELENRVGEIVLDGETLIGGWADVYVDNYIDPINATVSFTERCQYKDGKPASKWATSPGLMIRKCALVAALREAFPEDLGGLYAPEEMGFSEDAQNVAPIDPKAYAQDAEYVEVDEADDAEMNIDEFQNSFFDEEA